MKIVVKTAQVPEYTEARLLDYLRFIFVIVRCVALSLINTPIYE